MGNLVGHAAPGSFFLLFGLWWTIKYSVMWASRMGDGKTRSAQKVSFRSGPLRFIQRVPVEGLCKMAFSTAGLIIELMAAHWTLIEPKTGLFHILGNWQHVTMYLFFALNGFCDVLIAVRAPVPSGIQYASMSLACAVEGLLFFYHLHGRNNLDVHIHQLLLLAIAPCVAVIGLEAWKSDTLLLPMVRSGFALLQGTWFWQAGFILYPPFPGNDWDLESQENISFVTMVYCWHILGILLFMCGVYTIVYHVYQAKGKQRGTELELGPLSSHILQNQMDSDPDF